MDTYYYDSSTPTRQWNEMLTNARAVRLHNGGFILRDAQDTAITSGVIFVHRTYIGEDWSGLLIALEAVPEIITVVVSGASQVGVVPSSHPRLYFRQSAVATPVDLHFKRCATRFVEYLDSIGIGRVDFNLLEPDGDEALALKLLCEAYAMPTDATGSRSFQPRESAAKSIPVHCPDPCTWFGLLGAVAPTSERDEAAITVFGRLMGGAEEEAKDLARAIARKDTDIRTPAGKFVKKVSEKAVAANGGVQ
jgi:hypothetical protein